MAKPVHLTQEPPSNKQVSRAVTVVSGPYLHDSSIDRTLGVITIEKFTHNMQYQVSYDLQ